MSGPEPPPQYTKYRARPSLLRRKEAGAAPSRDGGGPRVPRLPRPGPDGGGRGGLRDITFKRVARWIAIALVAWVAISAVLFVVSAQIEQGKVSEATSSSLDGGGLPIGSPTNILVLGSDQRPKGTKEAGASTSGPSRSDSIMLLRIGGGANSRLSVARDTMVDIPGAGRQKINAAYAIGGASLAIRTLKSYLGVEVNHVIEVSFSEFPDLIDAMGGIDYTGKCVRAEVNGGDRNGGVTVRVRGGRKTHLDGRHALALARVRKNACAVNETDLDRARRQQELIGSMKSRVLSPAGFARLPWISWQTPRTFRTDMSGPTLMTVFGWMSVGGSPATNVLGTVSGEVPDALRRRQVRRFLDG